jgi:hypothetical protein
MCHPEDLAGREVMTSSAVALSPCFAVKAR